MIARTKEGRTGKLSINSQIDTHGRLGCDYIRMMTMLFDQFVNVRLWSTAPRRTLAYKHPAKRYRRVCVWVSEQTVVHTVSGKLRGRFTGREGLKTRYCCRWTATRLTTRKDPSTASSHENAPKGDRTMNHRVIILLQGRLR